MRIYISSCPEDSRFVKGLVSELKKAGHQVWYDAFDLYAGDNWRLEVGKALEKSNAMVVVLSPEAVKSTSVDRDIGYALGELRFKDRLIPLEVRPTKSIPWVLRRMNVIRASKNPGRTARWITERLSRRNSQCRSGTARHTIRDLPIRLDTPVATAATLPLREPLNKGGRSSAT